jgi:hypothetical protein
MQAQTAARYEDILAHVTLTGRRAGAGSRQGQPSAPNKYGTRPEYGTRWISRTPETGGRLRASPPTNKQADRR